MTILFILLTVCAGIGIAASCGAPSGSGSSGGSRQWTQDDEDELMAQLDNDLLDEGWD